MDRSTMWIIREQGSFAPVAAGYLAGLKQGWAFSWRSLMAAELITYSPALGIGLGQQLNIGRGLNAMDLVIASIVLILVVGVAIELLADTGKPRVEGSRGDPHS